MHLQLCVNWTVGLRVDKKPAVSSTVSSWNIKQVYFAYKLYATLNQMFSKCSCVVPCPPFLSKLQTVSLFSQPQRLSGGSCSFPVPVSPGGSLHVLTLSWLFSHIPVTCKSGQHDSIAAHVYDSFELFFFFFEQYGVELRWVLCSALCIVDGLHL